MINPTPMKLEETGRKSLETAAWRVSLVFSTLNALNMCKSWKYLKMAVYGQKRTKSLQIRPPKAGIRVIMNSIYLKVDGTTSDTKIKTVIKSDEINILTSKYWKLASKMRIERSKTHHGYRSAQRSRTMNSKY